MRGRERHSHSSSSSSSMHPCPVHELTCSQGALQCDMTIMTFTVAWLSRNPATLSSSHTRVSLQICCAERRSRAHFGARALTADTCFTSKQVQRMHTSRQPSSLSRHQGEAARAKANCWLRRTHCTKISGWAIAGGSYIKHVACCD